MKTESSAIGPTLLPDEAFLIRESVKDHLIEYWWDVDRNGARGALEFFSEDCIYQMCDHRMEGRSAIRSYYDYRDSRGHRLVRHVVSNLRAHVEARDKASLDGVMCVYAADGVPVLPVAPPILVADIACELLRGSDGPWRFRRLQITPLFAGGVDVLVPPPAS